MSERVSQRERQLTLASYIRRRNGVAAGARGGLGNMFYRSLGAASFAGFWRHWNPLFGYLLGRYVYAPLKGVFPPPLSLIITFGVCGAIHDLVTTAVRGSLAFFFTPWFLILALGLLAGRAARIDLSRQPWALRATANLAYLATCLGVTLAIKRVVTAGI